MPTALFRLSLSYTVLSLGSIHIKFWVWIIQRWIESEQRVGVWGLQCFHLWQADLHIDYQASVTATLGNIRCITRRYFSCQDQFLCDRMPLLCKTKGDSHVMLSPGKGHGDNNVRLHQRETQIRLNCTPTHRITEVKSCSLPEQSWSLFKLKLFKNGNIHFNALYAQFIHIHFQIVIINVVAFIILHT